MVKRMIGYAAVLTVVVYLFFMYDDTVLSGFLVFIMLYPFLSFAFLLFQRDKGETDLIRIPAIGEEGKKIRAGITVANHSAWNIRYGAVVLTGNRIEGKREKKEIRGVVSAGNTRTFWKQFTADFCGSLEITLRETRIYDPLSVFYRKKKQNQTVIVKLMPEFELMPLEITRKTREFQADAEEYSGEKKGDDPSEVYQVREYRTKDSFKDIHWKLTAAKDELMIKERAFPLGCAVLIWFDVREKECTAKGFSEMLKAAASLSITLVEEKCIHLASWYEENTGRIISAKVKDEESAYEMVWALMDMKPCKDLEKREICRQERFRGIEFSSTVVIDGQGRIKKEGCEETFLRV